MWRPSKLTAAQREERRLEGGRLLREGTLSHAEIARRLGVSRVAVGQWAQRLRQSADELTALKNRPRIGARPKLTDAQWQQVLETLRLGALAAGFETDRWTLSRIRALIRQRFGVTYHAHYLAERLKRSGWSPQVPAVTAKERDEDLVRAWLERDWPRIKKTLAVAGRNSSS